MRKFATSAIALATALAAVPASAAIFAFATPLSPEVTGATGSGFARVVFDTGLRQLTITNNWSGLSGVTTVAHIHCCVNAPGTVGVAVTPGTLPGFPTGVSGGSYATTLDLSLNATYTTGFRDNFGGGTVPGAEAALLQGLQDGRAYLNIHSNAFPGGEIRGFLAAVPEPASWAMMVIGFGALGAAMRHRGRRALAHTAA